MATDANFTRRLFVGHGDDNAFANEFFGPRTPNGQTNPHAHACHGQTRNLRAAAAAAVRKTFLTLASQRRRRVGKLRLIRDENEI